MLLSNAFPLLGSFLLVYGLMLLLGPLYIQRLKALALGQYIREDGPQQHHSKKGTPTAGGLLMLLSAAMGLSIFFFALPAEQDTAFHWLGGFLLVGFLLGGLGLSDDALKILKQHNKGLSGYAKLAIQITAGLLVGLWAYWHGYDQLWDGLSIGLWMLPYAALVVTAASNAVNLTDGLDGLAASTLSISFLTVAIWAAWGLLPQQHPLFLLAAVSFLAACLGFLRFNRYPAQVFMGDSGSLAFGGLLACLCVWGGIGLWLPFIGGIFVLETLSVILQVLSFKMTGKRLFRMAPLHHHFELLGWHETKVVAFFVALQLGFCVIATVLRWVGLNGTPIH